MKKVLIVIDSLNSGGAEKSLISLLSLFNYQKYEVDLLMFSPKGLYLPLLPKEVNVVEVPKPIRKLVYIKLGRFIALRNPYNKKNKHNSQISWKWTSKGLDMLNKKYDTAIAYSQGTPTYFVAEKVIANKKLCWINTDYRKAPYNKEMDRNYYEQYNNVIAVSDYCKEVFIAEMPSVKEKTLVIYDIISPELIKSMGSEAGGFNDDFDGLRILTIGRLVDLKGYDMAIEACSKLKQAGIPMRWYVIGEGNLKNKLEVMIKENDLEATFKLIGTRLNPYTYLKQCDLYVQPSRYEGYGLAIAEARIFQKPIVATDFTVVHNQLKDRVNGVIVNMDSEALYKGIKEIIDDNKLRNHLCENLSKEKMGTENEINKLYSMIDCCDMKGSLS